MSNLPSLNPRPSEVIKPNRFTGEDEIVPRFNYMPGRPFPYKFNGSTGQFLMGVNGQEKPVLDEEGSPVTSFTFQPIAYRLFRDCLFGRKVKDPITKMDTPQPKVDDWAEFFFIDRYGNVSSILFAGTTVSQELDGMIRNLFYQGQKIPVDVVITATPKQLAQKNNPQVTWFVAEFKPKSARKEDIDLLAAFDHDYPVYNVDTIQPTMELSGFYGTYFRKLAKQIENGTFTANVNQATGLPQREVEDQNVEVVSGGFARNEPVPQAVTMPSQPGSTSPQAMAEKAREIFNDNPAGRHNPNQDDDLPF